MLCSARCLEVFGLQAESICLWFLVWDFVRQQRGRLWLEFLPAYAPELNPVEYLWSHWKQHELPNFCPTSLTQLSLHARRALKRMRCRASRTESEEPSTRCSKKLV